MVPTADAERPIGTTHPLKDSRKRRADFQNMAHGAEHIDIIIEILWFYYYNTTVSIPAGFLESRNGKDENWSYHGCFGVMK